MYEISIFREIASKNSQSQSENVMIFKIDRTFKEDILLRKMNR